MVGYKYIKEENLSDALNLIISKLGNEVAIPIKEGLDGNYYILQDDRLISILGLPQEHQIIFNPDLYPQSEGGNNISTQESI
jgi:hypothetical protein